MAARQGFEPRQNAPEALVLPLHHRAKNGISKIAMTGKNSSTFKGNSNLNEKEHLLSPYLS